MVNKLLLVLFFCCCGYCGFSQFLLKPEYYLSLPEVSQDAKDYYSTGLDTNDKAKAYSVLDSVFTDNDITRPFYISLVCRMLTEADGDLLAELNIVCHYVTEIYPSSVIPVLFYNDSKESDTYKALWAERISVETRISCSGDLIMCFKESRLTALEHCAEHQKIKLEVLYNLVRKDLNLFQRR